jgi:hypothetical protein
MVQLKSGRFQSRWQSSPELQEQENEEIAVCTQMRAGQVIGRIPGSSVVYLNRLSIR